MLSYANYINFEQILINFVDLNTSSRNSWPENIGIMF
jgi:hypothetical protein